MSQKEVEYTIVEGDTITPPEVGRNERINSSELALHQSGIGGKNESAPSGSNFRNSL